MLTPSCGLAFLTAEDAVERVFALLTELSLVMRKRYLSSVAIARFAAAFQTGVVKEADLGYIINNEYINKVFQAEVQHKKY